MSNTNSIAWPNMFAVSQNRVQLYQDNQSITNRVRLLLQTSPTELYNETEFGVGLKKYIWQYNSENTKAMIQDNIRQQLERYEPSVDPINTQFIDGLLHTGSGDSQNPASFVDENRLNFTIQLKTQFDEQIEVNLNV